MTLYRFVQLSDIHFGQERGGTRGAHEDVREMLLADAGHMAETRGSADLVIVAGDTAYSAKEAEYKQAGRWLDQLTSVVKCSETNVRLVPGNHDCDKSALTRHARNAHRALRRNGVASAHADLEDAANGAEEANPFLPKLKAYREFAAGYNSDFESAVRPLWTQDFPLAPGIALQLVGMNSVQVSDPDEPDKDQPGNMILGSTQYILPDKPHLVYMVIMHHPLDWYMDKAQAKQYLSNRARVLLVGHEHLPYIQKALDMSGNERLEIYSGATNPSESGALYSYAYNWIEVSLRERAGAHVLAVNVFPRVWVPALVQFAPDTQRLRGLQSAEFEIACRALRPQLPSTVDTATRPRATIGGTAGATPSVADTSSGPGRGGTMATEDEAALAKLKFLFWRYLDWRQRLKVLVQADALPASADQPVPQTMERLAIEGARQRGKLGAIWDAMIPFVPDDKKQANPFAKTRSE